MSGTLTELLAQLDPDNNVRGKQFEHITKWYLQNDPFYAHELVNVWLWAECPHSWKTQECGIDLIAEHRNGSLWAIQAKAYAEDYSITKSDIDKWLTESSIKTDAGLPMFAYRLLVGTTDHVAKNAEDAIQRQLVPVGRRLRTRLEEAQVVWPATPADLRAPKPEPKSPRPHQDEAINDIISRFRDHDRGQFISAPGTGKTLTALFIFEQIAPGLTLFLVPSISLLSQTLDEWMANATTDFSVQSVCSDESVNTNDDIPVSDTASLGFPVTTDVMDIVEFLGTPGPRVILSTYQSSPVVAKAVKKAKTKFDLVIADEAHRTAGSVTSAFATVLDQKKIPAAKKLFMTATPRIYSGSLLREAKEDNFEQASMDDEAKFGPVFHELTFGDAIAKGLLTDYQVAVVGVAQEDYRDLAKRGRVIKFLSLNGKEVHDARTVATQVAIAKAMNNYNLHRIITFHSRVKAAQDFSALLPQVVAWMPAADRPTGQLWSSYVSGKDSADERKRAIQRLRNLNPADRGVLSNARCLTEGIDVPSLDGVAFIDPKRSMTDIVQAVGRAIRLYPGKNLGTIVIPVFVHDDEQPELAIEASDFKTIYDTILAMRSIDNRLAEEIDGIRREVGPFPSGYKKQVGLPPRIKIDIPCFTEEFSQYFNTRIIGRTSTSWEAWFELLKQYLKEHGDAVVPARYETKDGYALGKWVDHQRRFYARGKGELDEDRAHLLESLSETWSWDLHADKWEQGRRRLDKYISAIGDALVPRSYVTTDGYKLGQWVNNQRNLRRRRVGGLENSRIERLEQIGMIWEPDDYAWEQSFRHLQDYVDKMGNALVPHAYKSPGGYALGHWVAKQRSSGSLDHDRRQRLRELEGWAWSAKEARWEQGYSYLKKYVALHQKAPGATDKIDDYKVGSWAVTQRKRHREDKLPSELVSRLEHLGKIWDWSPKSGPR